EQIGIPYTVWTMISLPMPSKPGGWFNNMACSGIITAWYGMNMPNRNIVKMMSAPGNRHFEKTKPFIAPSIDDRAAATTARISDRPIDGASRSKAETHPAAESLDGRSQAVAVDIVAASLILVTTNT